MDKTSGGKLIYSKGIIFLIFAHYNHFIDSMFEEGDSIVTFGDALQDINFVVYFWTIHSLIQSANFDEYYFWLASLGDGFPEGINILYASKTKFFNDYEPINKKNNLRYAKAFNNMAGYIKGDKKGNADGKLGGILYFEKYNIYCLIYAKTPNHSTVEKDGKNIIYIITWTFERKIEIYTNFKTLKLKIFENETIMNVRAGKYGDDKVFIIYSFKPMKSKDISYGYVDMRTIPYIFDISTSKIIKDGIKMDKFVINTNKD